MDKSKNRGFTLLELMISMTILSLIVLIVFGATRLGYRSIEKAERSTEFLERVRTALNIIDSQFNSQVPLSYEEDGKKKLYFSGQKNSIQFSSNYSAWSGNRGYVKVIYSVEEDPNGRKSLYITENTISMDDSKKTLLLPGLENIAFYYFYKDPTEEHGEWREEWTDTTMLPDKVAVNIDDKARKISMNLQIAVKNKPLHQAPLTVTPMKERRDLPKEGRQVR